MVALIPTSRHYGIVLLLTDGNHTTMTGILRHVVFLYIEIIPRARQLPGRGAAILDSGVLLVVEIPSLAIGPGDQRRGLAEIGGDLRRGFSPRAGEVLRRSDSNCFAGGPAERMLSLFRTDA